MAYGAPPERRADSAGLQSVENCSSACGATLPLTLVAVTPRADDKLDVRGNLQAEIMEALWQLGEGTVDDVLRNQAPGRRRAYNTLQTVMNRLAGRGLLDRERRGRGFVYRPHYDEGAYLSDRIDNHLASASPEAKRAALHSLVPLQGQHRPGVAHSLHRIRAMSPGARRSPLRG